MLIAREFASKSRREPRNTQNPFARPERRNAGCVTRRRYSETSAKLRRNVRFVVATDATRLCNVRRFVLSRHPPRCNAPNCPISRFAFRRWMRQPAARRVTRVAQTAGVSFAEAISRRFSSNLGRNSAFLRTLRGPKRFGGRFRFRFVQWLSRGGEFRGRICELSCVASENVRIRCQLNFSREIASKLKVNRINFFWRRRFARRSV